MTKIELDTRATNHLVHIRPGDEIHNNTYPATTVAVEFKNGPSGHALSGVSLSSGAHTTIKPQYDGSISEIIIGRLHFYPKTSLEHGGRGIKVRIKKHDPHSTSFTDYFIEID